MMFEKPTLSKHGDVYSEKAWHHIYNIMRLSIRDKRSIKVAK